MKDSTLCDSFRSHQTMKPSRPGKLGGHLRYAIQWISSMLKLHISYQMFGSSHVSEQYQVEYNGMWVNIVLQLDTSNQSIIQSWRELQGLLCKCAEVQTRYWALCRGSWGSWRTGGRIRYHRCHSILALRGHWNPRNNVWTKKHLIRTNCQTLNF